VDVNNIKYIVFIFVVGNCMQHHEGNPLLHGYYNLYIFFFNFHFYFYTFFLMVVLDPRHTAEFLKY
jgi:hypothetical protein